MLKSELVPPVAGWLIRSKLPLGYGRQPSPAACADASAANRISADKAWRASWQG